MPNHMKPLWIGEQSEPRSVLQENLAKDLAERFGDIDTFMDVIRWRNVDRLFGKLITEHEAEATTGP